MDIKKYIASGILENYVLGLATESEVQEVEKNLLQYPELKAELDKIEDALATYAQAKAKPMPAGLSDSILASIKDLESTPSATSDTTSRTAKPQATAPKGSNILGIALGIALLGSLFGSYFLYQQKQDIQNQLTQTTAELKTVNDNFVAFQLECDKKDQQLLQYEEQLQVLKNPAFQPIPMAGTDKAPDAIATVYFNAADDKIFFDKGTLPAAPSDKDYQLWAIIDGVPTDMGVVDLSNTNWVVVDEKVRNPQAFAVTLETKGGNATPNLDELYVIGNV